MASDAELAAARQQIQGQAELGQAAPMAGAPPASLGQQVADSGAGATAVDIAGLLAQLQTLQERVSQVEDERAAERVKDKPGIVAQAELILAQLAHRDSAMSTLSVLGQAVDKAGQLVDAARAAIDSGDPAEAVTLAQALSAHLARVGPAAASADVSYPKQLLDEDFPESAAAVRPPRAAAATPRPAPAPAPAHAPSRATFASVR